MGCRLVEPDIVKKLREEEKQGLLYSKNNQIFKSPEDELNNFKDIELILTLQNGVIKDFLSDIKKGKIKTNRFVLLSLNELLNYYNSEYWKLISDKISIDKQILSFLHLVNIYIEHIEQSKESFKSDFIKNKKYNDLKKLKNMILSYNNVKG
jgi:hypothetical protein